MRLSTVFISSAFVLAGMSAAFSVEREDMLLARFADFEARAYDEEFELYARGSAPSKSTGRNRNPIHRSTQREPLLESRPNEDNRPQIYRSATGSRPNTDSRRHPATASSDSRLSTTTRQNNGRRVTWLLPPS